MSFTHLLLACIIVAGIVAVVAIDGYARTQRASRKQLSSLERRIDERLARLEQVEERIAVLEKIVTDRRFDLDKQFRDLDKTG